MLPTTSVTQVDIVNSDNMDSCETLAPVISNVISIKPDEFETIETVENDVKKDFTEEGNQQNSSPKKKVYYMR